MTTHRVRVASVVALLLATPFARAAAQAAGVDSIVVAMRNSGFRMGNGLMRIDAAGRVAVTSNMNQGTWAIGNRTIPSDDAQSFIAALDKLSPVPRKALSYLTDEGCVGVATDANIIDFTLFRTDTATTVSHYLGCLTYRDERATDRGKTLDNLTAWANAVAAGGPPFKLAR